MTSTAISESAATALGHAGLVGPLLVAYGCHLPQVMLISGEVSCDTPQFTFAY